MKQFGMYFQDDWRVTDRLTVNAGLRYDIVTGFDLDQSQITNFVALTQAAAAGRFDGVPGFEEFGRKTGEDTNNWQPRIGAVYDLRGNGKDVVRAGWGIYYDFGYTNANILFPGLSVQGGSGVIFSASNTAGIRNPDGSFFAVGQPITNVAANEIDTSLPLFSSNVAAPGIKQPWTSQTLRWLVARAGAQHRPRRRLRAHQGQGPRRAVAAQHAHQRRRQRAMRIWLNPPNPTMNMSVGESTFDGVNFGVRRRMDKGISLNAWYSLSKATGLGGLGVDELTSNLVQDSFNPYGDVQFGPSQRTDARHKITLSAVVQLPWGIYASPIFTYRSALPLFTSYGYDNNLDGVNNDIYPTAFKFDGVDDAGVPSFKEDGACEFVNCSRGAALSQFNLRVSKVFRLPHGMNIEAIAEGFNLFNAINPAFGAGVPAAGSFFTGTLANHTPNAVFMKPTLYAGDAGQPEQRVGQIGFRFTF